MKFSFGIKVGIAVTLLTASVTGISVYYLYSKTRKFTIDQINGRLIDIGHTATFLFGKEDRERIKRLSRVINANSIAGNAIISKLRTGDYVSSLSPAMLESIHASEDFNHIVQRLRIITYATMKKFEPPGNYYPMDNPMCMMKEGYVVAYLYIDAPESSDPDVVKFIASCIPFPTPDGWEGNPAGNLYRAINPSFSDPLNDKVWTSGDYLTDSFYSGLTAVVPLKDDDGTIIAAMGLDYYAGSEADSLKKLKAAGFTIIGLGIVISVIFSLVVSSRLSKPVRVLGNMASEVEKGNYNVRIDIKRNDEFGLLGSVFNRMILAIRSYLKQLEDQNRELGAYSSMLEEKVKERTFELCEANTRLMLLANSDSLTDLANRRFFDEYMRKEWHKCWRGNAYVGLIMIDVDFFKDYNDLYGHQAGDDCLVRIASVIRQNLKRPSDLAARYGGEEFVAVLPNTDPDSTCLIAEKILHGVHELRMEHERSAAAGIITISCGVASVVPSELFSHDILIKFADDALYIAKGKGRNRVEKSG